MHWILAAYPALSTDKSHIRDCMVATGFQLIVDFLQAKRDAIWQDLAFSRSLIWDSATKTLIHEDRNQIEKTA
jgi:hypothetical protein